MKIIMIRRDKRVVMELPDLMLDIQPEPVKYVMIQMHPMIKEFLLDTSVNVNLPPENSDDRTGK